MKYVVFHENENLIFVLESIWLFLILEFLHLFMLLR